MMRKFSISSCRLFFLSSSLGNQHQYPQLCHLGRTEIEARLELSETLLMKAQDAIGFAAFGGRLKTILGKG